MQILIHFSEPDARYCFPDKKTKFETEKEALLMLLLKLEKEGYRINTLFGVLIYNLGTNEIIDCGEPGEKVAVTKEFVDLMLEKGGLAAVIYTDKKYVVFTNKIHILIYFCRNRKIRPLSIFNVLYLFEPLIINERKELLDSLYVQQYEIWQHEIGKIIDTFYGDND